MARRCPARNRARASPDTALHASATVFLPSFLPGRQLEREIALPNIIVGLQLFDGGCVDDLALVDNRRVARKAKAKMHVLFGDQHRRPGATKLTQQFADPL